MTTTTQITTTNILDIDEWFRGDSTERSGTDIFAGFDIDAIRREYRDAVQAKASEMLEHEITIAMNGEVFGSYAEYGATLDAMESYDEEPGGFWGFIAEAVSLETIADRHTI